MSSFDNHERFEPLFKLKRKRSLENRMKSASELLEEIRRNRIRSGVLKPLQRLEPVESEGDVFPGEFTKRWENDWKNATAEATVYKAMSLFGIVPRPADPFFVKIETPRGLTLAMHTQKGIQLLPWLLMNWDRHHKIVEKTLPTIQGIILDRFRIVMTDIKHENFVVIDDKVLMIDVDPKAAVLSSDIVKKQSNVLLFGPTLQTRLKALPFPLLSHPSDVEKLRRHYDLTDDDVDDAFSEYITISNATSNLQLLNTFLRLQFSFFLAWKLQNRSCAQPSRPIVWSEILPRNFLFIEDLAHTYHITTLMDRDDRLRLESNRVVSYLKYWYNYLCDIHPISTVREVYERMEEKQKAEMRAIMLRAARP